MQRHRSIRDRLLPTSGTTLVCDGVPLADHRRRRGHAALRLQRRDDRARATARSTRRSRLSARDALRAQGQLDAGDRPAAARPRQPRRRELRRRDRRRAARRVHPARRSSSPASARPPPSSTQAVELGVKTINVESAGELERIDAIAARAADARPRRDARQPRHRRAEPSAHLDRAEDQQVRRAARRRARALPALRAARRRSSSSALHIHVGSQITDLEPLRRAAAALVALARELRDDGHRASSTSISAAASASRTTAATVPSAQDYAAALLPVVQRLRPADRPRAGPQHRRARRRAAGARRRRQGPRPTASAFVDPRRRHDRADAADALRRVPPDRAGGRPPRRRARATTSSVRSARAATRSARDRALPRLEVGDLIAILDAGAYGAVMASNYNRRPLPAEVLVDDGTLARHPPPPDDRRHARARDAERLTPIGLDDRSMPASPSKASTRAASRRRPSGCAISSNARGRECRLLSFPDYATPIGAEIAHGAARRARLRRRRDAAAVRREPLRAASRDRAGWLDGGADRSSAIATSRRASPTARRRGSIRPGSPTSSGSCRAPDLTILLDIAPETAVQRKAADRDRYERDLALLSRVRESYRRQAAAATAGCASTASDRARRSSADVITAVATRLAPA